MESNCPTDKVTDTNQSVIEYNNSIIPKDGTITTPNPTSTIPTQNDIIDEVESVLDTDDGTTTSEAINEGGSNCPTDKVTDTLSRYESTILLGKYKNDTTQITPSIPTQNDIIDEMEAYLMQLEDEIYNT